MLWYYGRGFTRHKVHAFSHTSLSSRIHTLRLSAAPFSLPLASPPLPPSALDQPPHPLAPRDLPSRESTRLGAHACVHEALLVGEEVLRVNDPVTVRASVCGHTAVIKLEHLMHSEHDRFHRCDDGHSSITVASYISISHKGLPRRPTPHALS